jgi:hypothetical protein
MRLITGTLIGIGLIAASPALAQAGVTVGMQVTDASGAPVGTVSAIQGPNLLIKTDKHEALLPSSSFRPENGKLLFGMTQAQLDAQIEQSLASASAAIKPGATLKGLGGTVVGSIDEVADGKATITLQDGKKIAVPQEGLRGNPDGTVTIGYSAAQLEAMVQGSSAPAGPSGE